ncbi:MAG: hypothetical protein DME02_21515 [Candidatus Rokuibacteriota bacterium]|nr:MAG: hypothetical protein DME02_21515 [Candidatus Rokubacteria bacterium]
MSLAFPIVRHPAPETARPILVSVPHYGTQPLPGIAADDYREPSFATFAYGFADTFAADVYGELHEHGATVLATPLSRMFVDVNRRRDDFEHHEGAVRSRRGAHGDAILLDGHTGSPRRMKDHQVIIGTCHDTSCAPALAAAASGVFARHGFDVHENVSGYTGGNVVATFGRPRTGVHALQLEINAALLMTSTADEFIARVRRGEIPERHAANIARIRACLRDVVAALPVALEACRER